MTEALPVDAEQLREEVQSKYRRVATSPHATFHFHTGRIAAARLGYDRSIVDSLPDRAVESFAGVRIGEPVDTFGGSESEEKARAYEVFGYCFLARNPE